MIGHLATASRAWRYLRLAVLILVLSSAKAIAAPPPGLKSVQLDRSAIAGFVAEAARRFAVPERWIWAVMRAESAYDPAATSHAGAMGLMQVMPATYAELRLRYRLGLDPYAPRDNVLAGTAYLRELHDRFGGPGFLAAYNAGPGRYSEHLQTGRPLPLETHRYVARIAPQLGLAWTESASPGDGPAIVQPAPVDVFSAPIFVVAEPNPGVTGAPASDASRDLFAIRTRPRGRP